MVTEKGSTHEHLPDRRVRPRNSRECRTAAEPESERNVTKLSLQSLGELPLTEIDRAFRTERIEIAFPRRDLHLRSLRMPRGDAVADQE